MNSILWIGFWAAIALNLFSAGVNVCYSLQSLKVMREYRTKLEALIREHTI